MSQDVDIRIPVHAFLCLCALVFGLHINLRTFMHMYVSGTPDSVCFEIY